MSHDFSPEIRARIDAHLDAVEQHLQAAGLARERRRGIVDDLETQILDMLSDDAPGEVTLKDVELVLSRLDPPEAYAKGPNSPADSAPVDPLLNKASFPPEAERGAWWLAGSLILILAIWVIAIIASQKGGYLFDFVPVKLLFLCTALLVIIASIRGSVLGWTAVVRIAGAKGSLPGLGWAVVEAILCPLALIWGFAFLLWYWIVMAYYNGDVPTRGIAITLIGWSCTALVLSVLLGCFVARLIAKMSDQAPDRTVHWTNRAGKYLRESIFQE